METEKTASSLNIGVNNSKKRKIYVALLFERKYNI
jgi:hypothetical protein